MSAPKYPNVKVRLIGEDGNALVILGRVRRAMNRAGVPAKKVAEFTGEATSGDYNHLLATVMAWVDVDYEEE